MCGVEGTISPYVADFQVARAYATQGFENQDNSLEVDSVQWGASARQEQMVTENVQCYRDENGPISLVCM